ncbi:TetR/AcrR family transcriptional regulator [Rhodococcus maanshanensis]|uniref:DNA-binding transcriptional regulator YbjK n=1 Tax=Rhodococcus maanshanensis TaxID=183556 RepID=A0A1H7LGT2_9NOCA|nr:TetR/AcrR family transcriptional regulator [Rhodococcus maanshanensis]SEK98164.1 DNA-binding transcriptional regulator YbjK [Rhodococcus maanshanensis]
MGSRLTGDERRVTLVMSALELAKRGGMEAVTIRAVAAHTGVSIGMVQYCFENKEELVVAMAEQLVLELSGSARITFDTLIDWSELRGRQGLYRLIRTGLEWGWPVIEANPERRLLTYEIMTQSLRHRDAGFPRAGAIAVAQREHMTAEVAAFLEECSRGTGTAWTEPVSAIARFGLASLDGLVLRWLVDRDTEVTKRHLDALAQAVAAKAVEVPADDDSAEDGE